MSKADEICCFYVSETTKQLFNDPGIYGIFLEIEIRAYEIDNFRI